MSLVSSELVGLIPSINSWKANATLPKANALNKIKSVKSDSKDLVYNSRGDSSCFGCGSKTKRVSRGTIGDIVNRLSCVDMDLNSIIDKINTDDFDDADFSLDDLISENSDLTADDVETILILTRTQIHL